MDTFISREVLDMLSYRSALGQSLKQISLRETPLELILDDIAKYRSSYIDIFKSEDSILRKYDKTLRTGAGSNSVLMMSWGSIFGLRNIRTIFRIISV